MEKFVYGQRKIRFCNSVFGNEPQANAVELAQLGGEGWFPTVWGNVPKGQKGKASFKNGGQAVPLNKGID